MKRLATVVLALVVLFSFVGCEDFSPLSLFLDGMNGNILGTSTENSDKAKEAVDNVIKKQVEVKPVEIAKKEVSDEKFDTDGVDDGNGNTTVTVPVEEAEKAKIEAESTKVGGIVITQEKKVAAESKANELAEKYGGVAVDTTNVLESISKEDKEDLLNKIAATKDNQKAKEAFITDMKQPAPAETQKATKGTVVVVSSAIDEIYDKLNTESENPGTPDVPATPSVQQQAAAALKETQKALESFIAPKDAEGKPVELTKADATIVKLAESFLTTTVQAVTETEYNVKVTKDAEGNVSQQVTSEVKPKTEVSEEAKQQIANEAAQLVTAMNTMSAASKIDTTALNDLITNLAGSMPSGGQTTRSLRAVTVPTVPGIALPGVEIPEGEQSEMIKGMVRDIHGILENVFEGQAPSSVVSHFRLHRMGYESYVANSDVAAIAADPDFNTIDSLLKYVVTSVIVEADNIKGELFAKDETGEYVNLELINKLSLEMKVIENLSVYDIIHQIYLATPAVNDPESTEKAINLPAAWFDPEVENIEINQDTADKLVDLLTDILKNKSNVMSILNTAEKVAEPVLEEGLASQILPFIQQAKDFINGTEGK